AAVVARDGVAEPLGVRAGAEEEEQEREPDALAALQRDLLEAAVGAVELGDLAAVADRHAGAVEVAHEGGRHRPAQVGPGGGPRATAAPRARPRPGPAPAESPPPTTPTREAAQPRDSGGPAA